MSPTHAGPGVRRWCTALALVLVGCASAPPRRPIDEADGMFAHGRHDAAAVAYASVAEVSKDRDEMLRARLFALLAQRAASGPGTIDRILAELRAQAVHAQGTPWGRLAGLYADEIAQAEALRWALQRAGADLGAREARIATLEDTLARGEQERTELATALQTLKDERGQQQRSLKELEEQLAARDLRLAGLEEELEALKRIDMSRNP